MSEKIDFHSMIGPAREAAKKALAPSSASGEPSPVEIVQPDQTATHTETAGRTGFPSPSVEVQEAQAKPVKQASAAGAPQKRRSGAEEGPVIEQEVTYRGRLPIDLYYDAQRYARIHRLSFSKLCEDAVRAFMKNNP